MPSSRPDRVVVTGLGLVTPVGTGKSAAWRALLDGTSGFRPVCSFDASGHSVDRGAEVVDFEPAEHCRRLDPATIGRASQLAIAAARLALADADLEPEGLAGRRPGVVMGTTSGEPGEIEHFNDGHVAEDLPGLVAADFVARYPCHVLSRRLAVELGLTGLNLMIPTACSAGNYAIACAYDALRAGRADVVLAGGADCFSRITFSGFARLGAIAPDVCRPFDLHRQGMIPGEGAALLVLETGEAATRRGARIYAEIAGYGLSCDAHHMTGAHPEADGAIRAMERALAHSGVDRGRVGYISAHGTGTPTNDRVETAAVRRVFATDATRPPVSSIKSMIGHTMGAASAIEAAVCALAINESKVPPTMNFRDADPECDLDCVPNRFRELAIEVAMSNSYAFGGNNASLILRRAEP